MDLVFKSLIIKRFRSIANEQLHFDNPTFFIGRNGAGKSNIVDALAFLAESMSSPLKAVFDRRGGISSVRYKKSVRGYPPNLGLGVVFGQLNGTISGGRYAFEVKALQNYAFEVVREQCYVEVGARKYWFERRKQEFSSNAEGLNPTLEADALGLPVVGGDVRFAPVLRVLSGIRTYSIEPTKLRDMQDPDSGLELKSDGSNAASVLQEIERQSKPDMHQIYELLNIIVPNTKHVRTIKHGKKLSLEFTQEWNEKDSLKLESFNMSDGTLRALGLLVAVFQNPRPTLLVVEEPESTIHPGALGAILDLLKIASKRTQVLVTTHSPDLLDAKWIKDNQLRMVDWQDGATRISPLSDESRRMIREHLMGAGELLRANALSAPPLFRELDGVLFVDL